jgi:hypothetical protein
VATAETTILTENQQLAGINADYEQRYGGCPDRRGTSVAAVRV